MKRVDYKITPTEGIQMDFISVEDKLPNTHEEILMTYNDLVMEGQYANGKFLHQIGACAHVPGYCYCEEQEGITHWMPLPKPPEE